LTAAAASASLDGAVRALLVAPMALLCACGGSGAVGDAGTLPVSTPDGDGDDHAAGGDTGAGGAGAHDGAAADVAPDGNGDGPHAPTAAELLAAVATCPTVASTHAYATDDGAAANVDICALDGAVFWKADMDIDCDGRNVGDGKCPGDDCCYQPQTAFTNKSGAYLAASVTPYVVIPTDFRPSGLYGGAVVAVIYKDKVQYAVFGDTGPDNVIGEASYACAAALGIDPDPLTGGTDGPVTYIAFLGGGAIPADVEDQAGVQRLGESLAAALLPHP
jgi:hypothetical protein